MKITSKTRDSHSRHSYLNKRKNMNKTRPLLLLFLCILTLGISVPSIIAASSNQVSLNKKEIFLQTNESFTLKITANGSTVKAAKWSSSKPSVAKVSSKGTVTALKEGSAVISAKITKGKYSGKLLKCKVTVKQKTYQFRYDSYLEEHFKKHGEEMGYSTKEEYLEGANRVIADPNALHKLESEDNDHVYYLEKTNEIVFVSQDGYIRTYFCPTLGMEYYERQSENPAA